MIPSIRAAYNAAFTPDKYRAFMSDLNTFFNYEIEFRICETPGFIDSEFRKKLEVAGEEILNTILEPAFAAKMDASIPPSLRVPGEDSHPSFIAIDFGICEDGTGGLVPKLIEMQGFASLFCYQEWLSQMYRKHFDIPAGFDNKFNGYTHERYIQRLKDIIIGDTDPKEVILLELEPWKQKTQIDFYCTRHYLGIEPVCLSEVIKEGRQLFYMNNGVKTRIRRIYNRVIFDELVRFDHLPRQFNLTDDVDVKWIAHPNWFFKISKYTMPFLNSEYVPETWFVNELTSIPDDLENWVLKPLFSFSGQGVIFDVTKKAIQSLSDPANYILQRKVSYAGAIQSPTGPVKCEIRLLYLWGEKELRPELTINLGRMSKGKMIGVRYNADFDWVGGTTYFLETD